MRKNCDINFPFLVNEADTLPVANVIPTKVTVEKSANVKLLCDAKGVPDPDVYWTRADSKEVIWDKPLLNLYSVDASNAGEYICHANNRKGKSRVTGVVEVISKFQKLVVGT